MTEKELKIIYQDENVLVIDKPAGVNSDNFKRRVHRLDKDTSGILLIAKNDKTLDFLQKQFKNRKVIKKYITLVTGDLKNKQGEINTLLGRSSQDKRKQKVYLPFDPNAGGKRKAITKYKVLQKFTLSNSRKMNLTGFENYTLIEVKIETGRKHQIRTHFAYLSHPIAGDKMYGFKNQPCPKGLKRQFLHASYLEITLPNGEVKEFISELPNDLKKILNILK